MRVSSCQNKNYVSRRFFQSFQKCIESFRCQHMHFVDDVNFVPAIYRSKSKLLPQSFYFFNTTIGSCVDFKHVHGSACSNTLTVYALTTRMCSRSLVTIKCLSQNARCTGLACTARSSKKISVSNPATCQCIGQSSFYSLLSHKSIKILRTPSAV